MGKNELIAAIERMTDENLTHFAEVCHDISKRLRGYEDLGTAARSILGLPDPEPQVAEVPVAEPGSNDVTIELKGVEARAETNGF